MASTDDEPVLLMALEVLCAEALVALGDHRAAQRVIKKAHERVEAPNGLMPLEKIGFLSMVRAEVWMTESLRGNQRDRFREGLRKWSCGGVGVRGGGDSAHGIEAGMDFKGFVRAFADQEIYAITATCRTDGGGPTAVSAGRHGRSATRSPWASRKNTAGG